MAEWQAGALHSHLHPHCCPQAGAPAVHRQQHAVTVALGLEGRMHDGRLIRRHDGGGRDGGGFLRSTVQAVRAAGGRVAFDPNYRPTLWRGREDLGR